MAGLGIREELFPLFGIYPETIKRMAYGFRDHEFFELKIYVLHEARSALVG